MTFLLDTHVLLWALSDPSRLTLQCRELIQDGRHAVFVSAVSLWEIAIKKATGKLEAPDHLEATMSTCRFSPLSISWAHASAVGKLPRHHKDPFDRMLIAQAQHEGLTLLTHDKRLLEYGKNIHLA